jgi:tetratricopeptide (TPR) repeat protein
MRFTIAILAMAVALGSAAPALAQPDEAAKREAAKLLGEGDKHFKRGDYYTRKERADKATEEYEKALAKYEQAFDLFPSPKIYYPIAQAEEKLGRWLEAIRHYRQLIEETEDLSDEVRSAAITRIDEVMQHVVMLVLIIEPDGATITIDGEVVGQSPVNEPYILPPGEHTIAVTAEGYTPFEATEELVAGEQAQRTIELDAIPVLVEKPKPRPPKQQPVPPVDKTRLWVGLGATGGLAALATITGLVAVSKHGTFSDDSLPDDERMAARDSGQTYAVLTDIFWVAAIGAGAYTAYYYYGTYKPEVRAREQMQQARDAEAAASPPTLGRSLRQRARRRSGRGWSVLIGCRAL